MKNSTGVPRFVDFKTMHFTLVIKIVAAEINVEKAVIKIPVALVVKI